MKKCLPLIFLLLINSLVLFSQDRHLIDSLENRLKVEKSDTSKAMTLHALFLATYSSNPDKGLDYSNQMLNLSQQLDFKFGISTAYNNIGVVHYIKGEYGSAIEFFQKSLPLKLEVNNKTGAASCYTNIGMIFAIQGNYPEALKNTFQALKLREIVGVKKDISDSYIALGNIYTMLGNNDESLKYQLIALKIKQEINDKSGLSMSYANIGNIYSDLGNYTEALKYFSTSIQLMKELDDKVNIITAYNNIGIAYFKKGDYDKSLENLYQGLSISQEIGDNKNSADFYCNIGNCYRLQKKYNDASTNLKKSLSLSENTGNLTAIKNAYEGLAALDSAQGNFKLSLSNYKLYIATRDSMFNEESSKKTVQLQMQYNFDKKQVADSLNFVREKEIGAIQLQKQKAYTYSGLFGTLITSVLLFLVYRNFTKQRIANQRLKEAQEQLIKSEKMAAFGIMASRVAHEIQNPLNFVNNFSELTREMVDDVVKSTTEEDKKQTADILLSTLQKINEHGKRAASIVKQLQERSSKGTAQEFFES